MCIAVFQVPYVGAVEAIRWQRDPAGFARNLRGVGRAVYPR